LKRISKKREEDLAMITARNKQLEEKLLQTEIECKKYAFDLSVQKQLLDELEKKCKEVTLNRDELIAKNEELENQL